MAAFATAVTGVGHKLYFRVNMPLLVKLIMKRLVLFVSIIGIGIVLYGQRMKNVVEVEQVFTPVPTDNIARLAKPVIEFKDRVTKKKFGLFVTPDHSPVQPEKFSGFHTGVDVEFDDVEAEVEVVAMDEGKVIQVGKIKGYGGVVIIKHQEFLSLYGHVVANVVEGQRVRKGEKIAVLGKGYSSDTNGERKHLHFGIIKGEKVDLSGYVHDRSDLDFWIDPMSLY